MKDKKVDEKVKNLIAKRMLTENKRKKRKEALIKKILADIDDIPPFSQIATKALKLINDPKSSAIDIGKVISHDQALTAKVLRMANSAYYGFPRKVATVGEAIVILGYDTLKSVVFALSMRGFYDRPAKGYALQKGELWRHAVACALTARLIGNYINYYDSEEPFVAGLLHDVGKLVLSDYVKEEYEKITDALTSQNSTFLDAERAVLGFEHQEIGMKISEKWNLPEKIVEAIGFHHNPTEAKIDPLLVSIVHVADFICLSLGIGIGADGMLYALEGKALEIVGINSTELDGLISQVTDAVKEIDLILN
ncbi:MAG TPA: HDOD domain-containing protein [Actinobacteria bacterium]|nr:HDOD domain-containing protein [Actinomycetota bacterium]